MFAIDQLKVYLIKRKAPKNSNDWEKLKVYSLPYVNYGKKEVENGESKRIERERGFEEIVAVAHGELVPNTSRLTPVATNASANTNESIGRGEQEPKGAISGAEPSDTEVNFSDAGNASGSAIIGRTRAMGNTNRLFGTNDSSNKGFRTPLSLD